jgi:transposase
MILSKKVERDKDLGQYIVPKGWIIARGHLQKTFGEIPNPYVTVLEGFFSLESSIDDEPDKIMEAYKNRDLAEKFIRDLKEGVEMRPIRQWSKHAVIGFVLIVFVTKVLVSLTQFFSKNPVVKNLKLLKIS